MKTRLLLFLFVSSFCMSLTAQVTTEPTFITKGYTGAVKIIFNPNEGDKGMESATECFAHTGLITAASANSDDWRYTTPAWGDRSDKYKMSKEGSNWVLNMPNGIYAYYGCPETEQILQLAFVFNNGKQNDGDPTLSGRALGGQNIYVDLIENSSDLSGGIISPAQHKLLAAAATVSFTCQVTQEAKLKLTIDDAVVKELTGTELTYSASFSKSESKVVFTAQAGEQTLTDERWVTIIQSSPVQARPSGLQAGITYNSTDPSKLHLCTYAASKTESAKAVYAVGDFNDWAPNNASLLKRDGNYFWTELTGLEAGKEYGMEYIVVRADGTIKYISDLYSTKLLHPKDAGEPKRVDSTLTDYPKRASGGYVTVLQPGKEEFSWSNATLNFKRPSKDNLVIYECWVYDYTPQRSFKGLIERLDYLQNLGINALELMPVTEFDDNMSWGYNPNHYFAPDKTYGSEKDLKTLIDECHKRGIAVILDMVFNHATGNNPMNKLYPWTSDDASTTELRLNPFFNVNAPHDDNVFQDWNHDFSETKQMFTRVLNFWIQEYKVDGYRMDLSHGLCGPSCIGSLHNNIKHYYNQGVKAVAQDAYFILEHWRDTDGTNTGTLISEGMMCWSDFSWQHGQLSMGYNSKSDISGSNSDGYVSYSESHDEERNFFKAKTWGSGIIATDENVRNNRIAANLALNVMLDGPHMFYMYNELGFDYGKFSQKGDPDVHDGDDLIKMNIKERPEEHNYFEPGARMNQYQKLGQLIQLRTRLAPQIFEGNPNTANTVLTQGWVRSVSWGSGENAVFVVANFHPTDVQSVALPVGTLYNYYTSQTASGTVSLAAGELCVFTGKKYTLPDVPNQYSQFTGIEQIFRTATENSTATPQKMMQNGQLYIIVNGKVYNVMGQML